MLEAQGPGLLLPHLTSNRHRMFLFQNLLSSRCCHGNAYNVRKQSARSLFFVFTLFGCCRYRIRRTATFCIGNVVKNHRANAESIVNNGGIEKLMENLTDEDEDELSNKTFLALANLEVKPRQSLPKVRFGDFAMSTPGSLHRAPDGSRVLLDTRYAGEGCAGPSSEQESTRSRWKRGRSS